MAKYLVSTIVNFKHQYLVETDDQDHVLPIWLEKSSPDNILHWDFIGENISDIKLIKSEDEYNDILDEADEGESAEELILTEEGMKFGENVDEPGSDFAVVEHAVKKGDKNVN